MNLYSHTLGAGTLPQAGHGEGGRALAPPRMDPLWPACPIFLRGVLAIFSHPSSPFGINSWGTCQRLGGRANPTVPWGWGAAVLEMP